MKIDQEMKSSKRKKLFKSNGVIVVLLMTLIKNELYVKLSANAIKKWYDFLCFCLVSVYLWRIGVCLFVATVFPGAAAVAHIM